MENALRLEEVKGKLEGKVENVLRLVKMEDKRRMSSSWKR